MKIEGKFKEHLFEAIDDYLENNCQINERVDVWDLEFEFEGQKVLGAIQRKCIRRFRR